MKEVKKTTTSVAQSIAFTCGTWFIEVNFTFGVKLNFTRKFKGVVRTFSKPTGTALIHEISDTNTVS